MKNFFPLWLACALVLACRPFEPVVRLGRPRRETEPSLRPGARLPGGVRTVYMTAVEFPESYDWERDTAFGNVSCRLLLFSGKDRVLDLPAGAGEEISPDPDMHRVAGGHLYTDYSTDTETVVRCDGKELFRYPGREYLSGFLVLDGHVHTLGVPRSGGGFTYRIDGVAVFSRQAGSLLPGGSGGGGALDERAGEDSRPVGTADGGVLYLEEGTVCFSYVLPGAPPSLYLVRDGKAEPVPVDPLVTEVMDQRLSGGVLYRIEKRRPLPGRTVFVAGEEVTAFAGMHGGGISKCRLVPYGDSMLACGWNRISDDAEEFLLCSPRSILFREAAPLQSFSILPLPSAAGAPALSSGVGPMACVLSQPSGIQLMKDAETWSPIGRYRLFTPSCACLVRNSADSGSGTDYYVALSGPSCILWKDGNVTPIQLHGYITGLYVE